jgi:hypothetical protein
VMTVFVMKQIATSALLPPTRGQSNLRSSDRCSGAVDVKILVIEQSHAV